MTRSNVAFLITIAIVVGIISNFNKTNEEKSLNRATATTVQPIARTVSSTTNSHISQNENIEKTLHRVAVIWKKTDVNNDGLNNCIDAAVLFYKYFPDKSKVNIIVNRNSITGMHHLFNSVLTDGRWIAIEPQAYAINYSNYSMKAVWDNQYDQSYNRDATNDYIKYVR